MEAEAEVIDHNFSLLEFPDDLFPSWYYLRDKKNLPKVTVCLLRMPGKKRVYARGVAVCGPTDACDQNEGRKLSCLFAIRAYKGRRMEFIAREEAAKVLSECHATFLTEKGTRWPELFNIEKDLRDFI